MDAKLTSKTELQYSLNDKKVIFSIELCNDGIATNVISV
jgi:hypothetical protein